MGNKQIEMEFWMPVLDYEGLYEVSDLGRVRSLGHDKYHPGRVLKPGNDKDGYYQVHLYKDGKRKNFKIHRLVYQTFNWPIPEGMVIDHVDGCKTNNCLENLRCVTPKGNMNNPNTKPRFLDAMRKLTQSTEWRKKNAEAIRKARGKSIIQIDKVTGEAIRKWECIMDVERELGIANTSISSCCLGKVKSAGGFKWRFFMPPAVIYNLSTIFEEY